MSQIRLHQIGDRVYVRDVQYEWLPAIVEDVKEHEVLVTIVLPDDWYQTTIRNDTVNNDDDGDDEHVSHNNCREGMDVVNGEQRWEKLVDYFNHHLPMQNVDDVDDDHNTKRYNDMSQLPFINEAELLYRIKKRHCSFDQPYTRITTAPSNSGLMSTTMMMVAVNPCRYIPSLYTIEKQQYYINLYMNQPKQHSTAPNGTSTRSKKNQYSILYLRLLILSTFFFFIVQMPMIFMPHPSMKRKKRIQVAH
jgi:hypothetical protein